jgi:magnesium chelatase family protein
MSRISKVHSVALVGVDGAVVEIECSLGGGLPAVHLVGLPDAVLQESRDRVRSAILNIGSKFPDQRVTLALSPATLRKTGSCYDLPMAAAILCTSSDVPDQLLESTALLGELALDGRVRRVRGVLPSVLAARDAGFARVLVPVANTAEAALIDGIEVLGIGHLNELLGWLRGEAGLAGPAPSDCGPPPTVPDLADVVGQAEAKSALEVAAAGAHHLLLTGPPGIGKTMLASRLPGILPPLGKQEALEVTAIHSIAGRLPENGPLISTAPFIAPHQTSTVASLVGGGSGLARPGAVSLAHRGVLFLDECPEVAPKSLESLRTPVEEGRIRLARADGEVSYPCRFQLVLAANPCPCAPARDCDCTCTPTVRRRYLGRLSGPLLDRVDLRVRMEPPGSGTLHSDDVAESSEIIRKRVQNARDAAWERWRRFGWLTNSEVPGTALRTRFRLGRDALRLLELHLASGEITARGADRSLRVAWTLCDLDGRTTPGADDVLVALRYRDRGWR